MDQIRTGKYIVSLIKALLDGSRPEEKTDDISFEDVYALAKKHHILNMCFYAIEQLETKPDDTLYAEWRKQVTVSSAQSQIQLSERNTIIEALKKNEIDCLPLKGCFLKEMYPHTDYREMADLDILIRKEDQARVKEVMESLGYHTKMYDSTNHDVYDKPPFMDVEMHVALFGESGRERFHAADEKIPLIEEPWKHALCTEQPYVYRFTPEDTYIFLILHLAKHFNGSGTGIRQFVDILVYNQKYDLDKEYVYQTLAAARMDDFCRQAEVLVDAWFNNGKMSEELEEMEAYIFTSGVYGNMFNRIRNRLDYMDNDNNVSSSASRYVLMRTFPALNTMRRLYPFLKKYPYLLPLTWIHRLISKIFTKDSPALRELEALERVNRS